MALDITELEKWPVLYLYMYIDSWMVVNALRGGYSDGSKVTGSTEDQRTFLADCPTNIGVPLPGLSLARLLLPFFPSKSSLKQ